MLDLLIRNISIADGSGTPMYTGAVAVKDGKIVKVAPQIEEEAELVIEGNPAQILSPGFFDTHSHNDMLWLFDPKLSTQLLQGVTYDLCGNCGKSLAPVTPENFHILQNYTAPTMPYPDCSEEWIQWTSFEHYLEALKRHGRDRDGGFLIGHGTLRIAVMGMDNRRPTDEEMERMKALLEESMQAGAKGMSSGLIYPPGMFSDTAELIELCKVVAKYDGVYTTHMRNESHHVIESVIEALTIARESGCKLIISHHKMCGDQYAEGYKESYRLITEAQAEGVRVICDQYQSNKGNTTLKTLFPPFSHVGGTQKLLERLRDPEEREKILYGMKNDSSYENFLINLEPQDLIIVNSPECPKYNGMHLGEIAEDMGLGVHECACVLDLINNGKTLMAVRMSQQYVVDEIFKFPFTAIGSDGIGAGSGAPTHPRAVSNQVHMLENYVRERKLVSWEEAIRKCTSLPADFLGETTKGHIAEGYDADIVIFDRNTVGSDASFVNSNVKPRGINYVFVKGKMAVKEGEIL